MIKAGDVFIAQLPQGNYGAFRVLVPKIMEKRSDEPDDYFDPIFLIAVTPFMGKEKPTLDDKRLMKTLFVSRYDINKYDKLFFTYTKKNLETNFEYLGNIPLSQEEKNIYEKIKKSTIVNGPISKDVCYDSYYQWVWNNDRDNFEEIFVQEQRTLFLEEETKRASRMKNENMMNPKLFWQYIRLINPQKDDPEEAITPLVKALSKKSRKEIRQFDERLSYCLYKLDTKELASNIGEYSYSNDQDYFSPDNFLYARCFVVKQGESTYRKVISNPQNMIQDSNFELLLEVPALAYEKKTYEEYEYMTKYNYETFSNKKGWR